MFTGLVEEVGVVRRLERSAGVVRLVIGAQTVSEGMRVGDSILVSGACLTVVAAKSGEFAVECMPETLSRTTIGSMSQGGEVNLERSLAWGDRMGGHLVMGHVDAVAPALSVAERGIALEVTISLPEAVRPFLAAKGSVAVDGVSLTVIEVDEAGFTVGLMPHTVATTTLRSVTRGTKVNLEADIIARYVYRSLRESERADAPSREPTAGLTQELLRDKGFI